MHFPVLIIKMLERLFIFITASVNTLLALIIAVYIFAQISHWVQLLGHTTPLPIFVAVSSFLEEVVPPIILAPILVIAGSIAHSQGFSLLFILWLSVLSALSKTLGCWLLYYLGSFAENVLVHKWGSFFGIDAQKIETFGKRFQKKHSDIILLAFLRAIPILPSAPISIACGVIKLNMPVYLIATFIGSLPKVFLPLYAGFAGIKVFHSISDHIRGIGAYITIAIVLILIIYLIWRYWRVKKK